MKADIEKPEVLGVQVAIARQGDADSEDWHAYLINKKNTAISNVLIVSKGYGIKKNKELKTGTFRQFFEKIEANSYATIERMTPEVFKLCNEFWVTYYIGSLIYDKKFIFLPETIQEKNMMYIDAIEKEGILHD